MQKVELRTCKVCGETKPFARGTWVYRKGKCEGQTCRACLTTNGTTWKKKYPEKHAAANLAWHNAHPEQRWAKRHPARACAQSNARRLSKQQRTPPGTDMLAIAAIYEQARVITQQTGIPHQVDHIVPLHGRKVSGLHVAGNLQILPAHINRAKSNKFDVMMTV